MLLKLPEMWNEYLSLVSCSSLGFVFLFSIKYRIEDSFSAEWSISAFHDHQTCEILKNFHQCLNTFIFVVLVRWNSTKGDERARFKYLKICFNCYFCLESENLFNFGCKKTSHNSAFPDKFKDGCLSCFLVAGNRRGICSNFDEWETGFRDKIVLMWSL